MAIGIYDIIRDKAMQDMWDQEDKRVLDALLKLAKKGKIMDQERFDELKAIMDDACNDFRNIDIDYEPDLENIAEEIFYELERLRDGSVKTADGVAVIDSMELFSTVELHDTIMECHARTDAYWVTHEGQHVVDRVEKFYSTKEAAKEAKGKE